MTKISLGDTRKSYQPDKDKKYFLGFGLSKCAEAIEYYGYQDHFSNPLIESETVAVNDTVVTNESTSNVLRLVFDCVMMMSHNYESALKTENSALYVAE